jgi:hypothetical protein
LTRVKPVPTVLPAVPVSVSVPGFLPDRSEVSETEIEMDSDADS